MNGSKTNWQAESDAYTLAEARKILNDPKRLTAAVKVAEKLANATRQQATALTDVSKKTQKTPMKR